MTTDTKYVYCTRILEWDAGHRVLGHEGKCRNVHGHRYKAEITCRAQYLDDCGRVVDFSVIKERIGAWLDEHWDHNYICHPLDPIAQSTDEIAILGRAAYKLVDGMRYYNPTAENLAAYLLRQANSLLPAGIKCSQIRLWETPNSYADAYLEEL